MELEEIQERQAATRAAWEAYLASQPPVDSHVPMRIVGTDGRAWVVNDRGELEEV